MRAPHALAAAPSAALNRPCLCRPLPRDCAQLYKNENIVGEAIADCLSRGVVKREELWVTSKLPPHEFGSPAHIIPSLKKTLSDLRLTYVDLYLTHWPVCVYPPTHTYNAQITHKHSKA